MSKLLGHALAVVVLTVTGVAGGDVLPPSVPLPIDKAIVHQAQEPGQGLFARLARGVVVVDKVSADKRALAVTYALGAAPEPTVFQLPKFKATSTMYLLTVGPLLDSPDTIAVKRFTQAGKEIELVVEHTQKRTEGARLPRNIPFRPMIEVPFELASGTYRLTVIWIPTSAAAAQRTNLDPVTHSCSFTVER